MSNAFACVLGVCFVALGLAECFLAFSGPAIFSLFIGSLFLVTGIACFFYRKPPVDRHPG
jgi:hypothetical protein